MRTVRLVFVCAAFFALALPASAMAAERMFIGFQDDPSFRWREDRTAVLDEAANANAGVVRTTVYWSRIATRRPASPTNSEDSAYVWDDLDELVRGAQFRGMETLLTIWGTPNWANRSKGQNRAPDRIADLTDFARALASRYSGRNAGLPYVRLFSVWNEPNLEQFLAPTFDKKGKPVAPFTYAKMYRAAYAGIKAGNPPALVGVGETSPRGRDKPSPGIVQDSIAPGTFARLLSTVRPKLKFSAWAQHPYSMLGFGPRQRARYPNVHVTQLKQFEKDLKKWFGRTVDLWITEYGFETRPAEPKGVSLAQQSAYTKQAFDIFRRDSTIKLVIWFILRDDPTSTWQSGLISRNGAKKPAFSTFTSTAKALDARNPIVRAKIGVQPVVRIPVLELAARDGAGALIGANIKVYGPGNVYQGNIQQQTTIGTDGWASFIFASNNNKRTYFLNFEINDKNGNLVRRSATLLIV
jgi:hypothetical protein